MHIHINIVILVFFISSHSQIHIYTCCFADGNYISGLLYEIECVCILLTNWMCAHQKGQTNEIQKDRNPKLPSLCTYVTIHNCVLTSYAACACCGLPASCWFTSSSSATWEMQILSHTTVLLISIKQTCLCIACCSCGLVCNSSSSYFTFRSLFLPQTLLYSLCTGEG